MQVEFDYDGHRFKTTKITDNDVSIYVDGKFWRTEGNIFSPIPDDEAWLTNATKGAWDFEKGRA